MAEDQLNRQRLAEIETEVRAASLTESQTCERLGITPSELSTRVEDSEMLSIRGPLSGVALYPAWQFELADGYVVLPRLLRAAGEAALSPLQLQLLLSNPAAGFDGLPLAAALPERLDDVAAVVSASNDIGG